MPECLAVFHLVIPLDFYPSPSPSFILYTTHKTRHIDLNSLFLIALCVLDISPQNDVMRELRHRRHLKASSASLPLEHA